MLISPPFLLARAVDQSDAQWLEQAMQGGIPGEGGFPVSYNLGWHGGIHLEAPTAGTDREMVRAIADGTVVYVRKPSDRPNPVPEDHPLNYRGGWTSDGCVIIQHKTEIGADANGQATTVTFYSITMHLHTIRPAVRKGRAIYRKDEIGQAGYIYGEPHKIHFEIVCDDENLPRLIGRASGDLNTGADGRTDAVYGEMHFHLPAGTAVYAEEPLKNNPVAHRQPPAPQSGAALPPTVPLAAVHTTTAPLFVGLRYAGGEGGTGNRGDAYNSTYHPDGTTLGAALEENDAEYNIYQRATDISNAYPANVRPAPSAVYELLRFGRVIGPDALAPADVPHWRRVRYPGGEGWVNLNAANVTRYSDADFPHWKGWKLIDDTADLDSRCDSATIKGWLDEDQDGKVDPNEAVSLLSEDRIQDKMRRTICKLPTEWEKATVDHRWNWLTKETDENPAPLSDADFLKLRKHIEELAFWEDANIGISSNHWHFHPREFIRQFRMCGWLCAKELKQMIPVNVIRKPGSHNSNTQGIWEAPNLASAQLIATNAIELNKTMRKFVITSPYRIACFLGNAVQETQWLRYVNEGDGNNPNLHQGWYGRGFLQLTNPNGEINQGNNNYYKYFKFVGWAPSVPPGTQETIWRDQIAASAYHSANSAGAYWVWPNKSAPTPSQPQRPQVDNANRYADIAAVNERRTIATNLGIKVWYYNQSFTNCAAAVNYPATVGQNPPNMNGLVDRSVAFINAMVVLADVLSFPNSQNINRTEPENFVRRAVP